MSNFKAAKYLSVLLVIVFGLTNSFNAEAQLLKRLKQKAEDKAKQKIEQRAEQRIDRALDGSIDSLSVRIERLFGKKDSNREKAGKDEIIGEGKADGFASISFGAESYQLSEFTDVVCTFYKNGVSINAISSEQYGLSFELINVPIDPEKHNGVYDKQAYSTVAGMASNIEYYTRPGLPTGVGSVLKEGTLTVANLDQSSIYLSFNGSGGNNETDESINMSGTIKLDFSYTLSNDGLIQNTYAKKKVQAQASQQEVKSTSTAPPSGESGSNSSGSSADSDENAKAMEMMQQMMGSSSNIDLPSSYSFDYMVSYEMKDADGQASLFSTWMSAKEKISMVRTNDDPEMMIMDDERKIFLSLNDEQKQASAMSSKMMGGMSSNMGGQNNANSMDGGLNKTGKTKNILGYRSEEYVIETPDKGVKVTVWLSNEVGITVSPETPLFASLFQGAAFTSEQDGFLMELHSVESGGEERHMAVKDISKRGKTVKMSDYKVMKGFGN